MTIGGLLLGGLGALVFVVLLNYVIQPQMSVETRGLVAVQGERFNVWYHKGSPHRDGYPALHGRLVVSFAELLSRLHVEADDIPSPIDVLVHDTPLQMQASIVQRKSTVSTHTFYAVIDLLAGEDPYRRLAEAVLAFGWGECRSQLLYTGMRLVAGQPERGFHAPVAAAPVRFRYALPELLRLEQSGAFEKTLYQLFDSPYSPSMALGSLENIAALYAVFGSAGGLAEEEDLAALQAASLVQYLIGCNGGVEAIQRVWGPGTTTALLERLACGPLDELSATWLEVASAQGREEEEYPYYRPLHLFESGAYDAAHRLTSGWKEQGLPKDRQLLAIRCALSVGAFDEAYRRIEGGDVDRETVEAWDALYRGWNAVSEDGVRVYGMETETQLAQRAANVHGARDLVRDRLGLSANELPQVMTVFFYNDAEAAQTGRVVTPNDDAQRTAWHVTTEADLVGVFAETLPAYAYGLETSSSLLRTGLAAALTTPFEELVERGCRLLESGEWTPLWQLGFGGEDPELLEIEMGLAIGLALDRHGPEVIRALWAATARLGGGMSLASALEATVGTSWHGVEEELQNSVLVCDGGARSD